MKNATIIIGQLVLTLLTFTFISAPAYSANVLFVDDDTPITDNADIETALIAAGHTVTYVTGDYINDTNQDNTLLQGNLSAYSIIVWAATGDTGFGDAHSLATTSNLASWVSSGGWLFITGYDTIASPTDPNLITLIGGGTNSTDETSGGALGPIVLANELSTGTVNLVGITPDSLSDQDSIPIADLVPGTVCVSGDGVDCSWTLRTLGAGRIAYVSTDANTDINWLDTGATATGAYNGALRNFVANAAAAALPATAIPTLSVWGLGLLISLLGLFDFIKKRRHKVV